MNLQGENVKQITKTKADEAYPCISPDGTKIAFTSNRDGNWEIYVMNIDGSDEKRLTFNNSDDIIPVFTKDSQRIVFQSNRDGNYELYLVDINNPKVQERLTINEFDDIHPSIYRITK